MRFSANLGFLWSELALLDAVQAAKRAGFDAVECHWPYHVPPQDLRNCLSETGMPLVGINTRRGDPAGGEFGLAAVPGRESEARAHIEEAIDYAAIAGAAHVHVMAGCAVGSAARQVFLDNLSHACAYAHQSGIGILIEPLNRHDAPGYFLGNSQQAIDIITDAGHSNLKLMFDCYHVGRSEGDVITRLTDLLPHVGHIQFASVPDRTAPDAGELDYDWIFAQIDSLGWDGFLGAEYRPNGPTEKSLAWLWSNHLQGQY